MSFSWVAGGTIGTGIIGETISGRTLRRDPGMIALLVVTGQLEVLASVFALALVSPWGRRLMRTLAWIGGGGLLLYSIALLVQHGLMAVGVIERAA
ncbi:MAG: DUF3995 domain-containing protein, partial [Thermomicrobiales bacterium]|nr:DUF3995 domain-containing protein [Thermomicrobiales bacterium]